MAPPGRGEVTVGRPLPGDGPALWRIARDAPGIDVNSPYFYVLWCRDFATTSAVARTAAGVRGYLVGFARPQAPDTLFVWQTAVDAALRGRGLARRMLDLVADGRFRHVEATVAPDNHASAAWLSAFARDRRAGLVRTPLWGREDFPGADHGPEVLFRVGPLTPAGGVGAP
ncbi:diaminobutyrate acetyltransferase [Streptomyces sp. NPDC046939]|uniref:diaminobutyrate acetyltransferase n=1 Tax=Streptomyces sp. NPDC046939 TaxID=3155376 RepID=UPI0033CF298E